MPRTYLHTEGGIGYETDINDTCTGLWGLSIKWSGVVLLQIAILFTAPPHHEMGSLQRERKTGEV